MDFSSLGRGQEKMLGLLETAIKTASCPSVNQSGQFLISYRENQWCLLKCQNLTHMFTAGEIFSHVLFNMKTFFNKVIYKI